MNHEEHKEHEGSKEKPKNIPLHFFVLFVSSWFIFFVSIILIIELACQPINAQPKAAPDWTLQDINARQIRLQDYRGKVVLLNFWATWCAPCLAEIPQLMRWQRRYAKAGLQIIGITYPPQTKREIQSFVRKRKITYPIIQGTTENKSYFTASETLPYTIVLDRKGNVHVMIEGILFEEEFAEKAQPLLSEKFKTRLK